MGLRFRYSVSPQRPQTCSASPDEEIGSVLATWKRLAAKWLCFISLPALKFISPTGERAGTFPFVISIQKGSRSLRMSEIVNLDIYPSKWRKDKNQHHVTSQHCEHHASLLIVQKKDLEKKHRLCLVNLLTVLRASMIFLNKTLYVNCEGEETFSEMTLQTCVCGNSLETFRLAFRKQWSTDLSFAHTHTFKRYIGPLLDPKCHSGLLPSSPWQRLRNMSIPPWRS